MANKCIMYTALVVVCLGIGALVAGLAVYYAVPDKSSLVIESYDAQCELMTHNSSIQTISGSLQLTQNTNGNVTISGNIDGLPEGPHGFHVHAYGVVGNDCTSTGGHFNPQDVAHGSPSDLVRHNGDLGNINVTSAAGYNLRITDHMVSLYGVDSVVGRAIVIHEIADDFVSQPSGAAGSRLACCTITHLPE